MAKSILEQKHIILGVTGGVAAYKAVGLASMLYKAGALVDVIMTEAAREFVKPLSFASITRRNVHTCMFASYESKPGHISLAENASLAVVAPATANTLAKMACGIADNLLLATLLATRAPVMVAPAMNDNMWSHPATKTNLDILEKRGVRFVGPESGMLACGREGMGRMSEPEDIFSVIEGILSV